MSLRLSDSSAALSESDDRLYRAPGKVALTQRMARGTAPSTPSIATTSARAAVQRAALAHELAAAFGFAEHPCDHADAAAVAAPVQRHGDAHTGLSDDAVATHAAAGVSGAGGVLPHLESIQRAFGPAHDLSGVRAHVGGAAADASSAIGAHAYATGNDIAFASSPDLFLAAHEATHIVQQRQGVHLKGAVGQAGDSYEQHADTVAAAVVRGEDVSGLLGSGSGSSSTTVQRKEGAAISDDKLARALTHYPPMFQTLWTPPFVSRVRDALAAAGQSCAPGVLIDLEFARAVAGFQAASGLTADGVAGAATLVKLLGGTKADYKPGKAPGTHAGAQDDDADATARREYQVMDLVGGSESGASSYAAINAWDTAKLSYGRYQNVLKFGAIGTILERFVAEVDRRGEKASAPGRELAPRLRAASDDPRGKGKSWIDLAGEYNDRKHAASKWLSESPTFVAMLISAGQAPEMQVAQDGFHREELFAAAREQSWSHLSTTLGWYVTGHAFNHAPAEHAAGSAAAGTKPATYADEAAWLQRFNEGAAAYLERAETRLIKLATKTEPLTKDENVSMKTMKANLGLAHWKRNDFNGFIADHFTKWKDAESMNAASLNIPKVHYAVSVVDGAVVYTAGHTTTLKGGTPEPAAGEESHEPAAAPKAGGPKPPTAVAPSTAAPAAPLSSSAAARAIAWYERQDERYPPEVVTQIYAAAYAHMRADTTWALEYGEALFELITIQFGGGIDEGFVQGVAGAQKALGLAVDGKAGTKTLMTLLGHDPRPDDDDDDEVAAAAAKPLVPAAPAPKTAAAAKAAPAPKADQSTAPAPAAPAATSTAKSTSKAKTKTKAKAKAKDPGTEAIEKPTGDIARAKKDAKGDTVFDDAGTAHALSPELLAKARAHAGGQNMACYAYYNDQSSNNAEFVAQAANGAVEFDAIGVNNGHVGFARATAIRSAQELVTAIQDIHATLLEAHRAEHPDDSSVPAFTRVINLGIYSHGTNGSRRGLKTDAADSVDFSTKEIKAFVAAVRGSLASDVNVSLFACQVGNDTSDDYKKDKKGKESGKVKNGYAASTYDGEAGSFAGLLAAELGDDASVIGHTTSGHTTENYDSRVFGARARAAGATGGAGTHVFNEIFPPAFIDSEELRLWGVADPSGKRRDGLRHLMFDYYKLVEQREVGWGQEAKRFDTVKDGEDPYGLRGHYGGYKSLPPVANYYGFDPDRIAGVLRDDWRQFVVEEHQRFASLGALTPAAAEGRSAVP